MNEWRNEWTRFENLARVRNRTRNTESGLHRFIQEKIIIISRDVQYVLSTMRKCIMVKVGVRNKKNEKGRKWGEFYQFCRTRGNMQNALLAQGRWTPLITDTAKSHKQNQTAFQSINPTCNWLWRQCDASSPNRQRKILFRMLAILDSICNNSPKR